MQNPAQVAFDKQLSDWARRDGCNVLSPCYCSGRCRELGYCPSNPPWQPGAYITPETIERIRRIMGDPMKAIGPLKPRYRVKAGRQVIAL